MFDFSTGQCSTFRPSFSDAGNRLISESLPNGVSKTHTYDAQGRELSVTATKSGFSNATRSFIYDLAGNVTKATQGSKVIDLTYDSESRLTQVSTDAGDTSTQAFNATTGKQTSLTTVAGAMNYTWNSNGLLSTVQDPFTNQTTTYTWDSAGRVDTRTDPAGLVWDRNYDAADRVDTQTIVKSGTTLASFDLGYDAAGNVTSRAETVKTPSGTSLAGSGTWTYGYDAAGRMTSATDPSSVQTIYAYDRAGNRTSVQVGAGPVVTTTYDQASLPTSSSDGLTYAYDAMGTLVSVDKLGGTTGDQCFAYDGFGLLASFKANSTTGCGQGTGDVQYSYDALGRRVSRVGATTTTSNFILDGEDLARTTTAGTATLYAFSPEGLMASSTGGSARFFLKDLHGDTVGAVNASGSVMGSKLYSPWGEPAASAGETYTAGFQSQPTDADTGYVDMTTRLYSPTQGRFSSRDVLFGDTNSPASMNQYGYAEGSPVTYHDFTGMAVCLDLKANIVGTPGDDRLIGNSGPDIIAGLGGDDEIIGKEGADFLCGDEGHDVISAGNGNDFVDGGTGPDLVEGWWGSDYITGGGGADDLSGDDPQNGYHDEIHGEGGDDEMYGGGGPDVLWGGPGTDEASGGPGRDSCRAEEKDDCERK